MSHGSRGGSGIESLLQLNVRNFKKFMEEQPWRRDYRKMHGTEISTTECMDGRLNFSLMAKIPLGIIRSFKNLGGKFNLGWPHFHTTIQRWKEYADSKGRDSVILLTYHYSRGSSHRGCAGHNYDVCAARDFTLNLKKDFDRVYGNQIMENGTSLFTIEVGMETDLDALVFHGEDGQTMDLSGFMETDEDSLFNRLVELYPSICRASKKVIFDLVPIVQGNILHSREVKNSARPLQDLDHRESVLAVGDGFDWLRLPNKALIVGPWQDNLSDPIATATRIIAKNLRAGVIRDDELVLITSSTYKKSGERRSLAELQSSHFKELALEVIKEKFPELLPRFKIMVTIVDIHTRKMDVIG